MKLWKDSILLDAEMETLKSGLAGALKEMQKTEEYLATVDGYIRKFQTEIPESKPSWCKKIGNKVVNTVLFRRQNADPLEKKVKSIFLLRREHPAPHGDRHANMVEIFKKLHDEHVDFLKQIWLELKLHDTFKSLDLQEFEALAINLTVNIHSNSMVLNEAAKKLYMDIAAVLKSPLKKGQDFVTSLLEVAEMANTEGSKYC
jgi:hypothetical protein